MIFACYVYQLTPLLQFPLRHRCTSCHLCSTFLEWSLDLYLLQIELKFQNLYRIFSSHKTTCKKFENLCRPYLSDILTYRSLLEGNHENPAAMNLTALCPSHQDHAQSRNCQNCHSLELIYRKNVPHEGNCSATRKIDSTYLHHMDFSYWI